MVPTRLPPIENHPDKVQLERLSFVYFEHEDLEAFAKFADDFGFVEALRSDDVILYRGYGKDPYCYVARRAISGGTKFGGPAFVAQSQADFDKAAALEGAHVTELSPFPGGGKQATLQTPAGFFIHIVFGQEEREVTKTVPSKIVDHQGPANGALNKQRFGESI